MKAHNHAKKTNYLNIACMELRKVNALNAKKGMEYIIMLSNRSAFQKEDAEEFTIRRLVGVEIV